MLKASSSDHVIKSLKVPADKRAWTTQLIGTWSGRIHRQDLELAVWIPKLDSPQSAQARLNLYMESTDGRCIYGDTQGHLAQAYAFNLPATPEVYDEIQLRYYFMPDVYNETREGRNYCSKNRDIYPFYLYYDYASGQVFAHPKGYQPGSSDAQKWQWPLQRTNPSPKMKQFLIGLEQKYGKGFFSGQKPLLMVSHCLDSDAMVVVKKLDVPGYTVKEVYSSGMEIELSRTEGYTMRSSYIINPEFWPTCQKICGVQDSKSFRSFYDLAINKENAMMGKLYSGLKSLRESYDCRSKEIQTFEENLIRLSRLRQSIYASRKSYLSSW